MPSQPNHSKPHGTLERSATDDGSLDDNNTGPSRQSEERSADGNGPSHQLEEEFLDGNEGGSIGGFDNNIGGDEEEYWLDPALRPCPPATIVNDVATPSHIPRDGPSLSSNPFPDHPPQSWEMYSQPRSGAQASSCDVSAQIPHLGRHHGDPNPEDQTCTNTEQTGQLRRQPATPRETGLLALRNEDSALTEWLKISYNGLSEGNENFESGWSKCIEKWMEFEKSLPLSNLSAVRISRDYYDLIISKFD